MKINYIEFGARDMAKIQAFYEGCFGWTFQDYGPSYKAFNDGALDGGFALDGPIAKGALVILYTEHLEDALDAVKAHGGTIIQEIYSFPGGRRFHFTDPDGNELAVWSDK